MRKLNSAQRIRNKKFAGNKTQSVKLIKLLINLHHHNVIDVFVTK